MNGSARSGTGIPGAKLVLPALLVLVALGAAPPLPAASTLVFCAPGYPGSTEQAQPMMASVAETLAEGLGWPEEDLAAVYFPSADGGVARLREPDAAWATVTLPLYLQTRSELGLRALLRGVQGGAGEERWALVARRGAVATPSDLAGWEIASTAGYAPAFVRGPALSGWGTLPEDVDITFTPRILSELRRAAEGEQVAVLLDGAQTAALDRLPFADRLEILVRSPSMPTSLVCSVGDKASDDETRALAAGLAGLHETDAGAEALAGIRIERFEPLPDGSLDAVETAYETARAGAP